MEQVLAIRTATPDEAAKRRAENVPVVLGYSGGGDSTFLLHRLCAVPGPVLAVVVDHGLREGSAADAARAAAMAREAGAATEIATIAWPDGPHSSQARARRARLEALAAHAGRVGARDIYLAHTLDDQAETVLIRLAANSSWRGLAGMGARAPLALWPAGRGLSAVRPLLGERRSALRVQLAAMGADWIEDPANALDRYARVRARAALAQWEAVGLGPERWALLADQFGRLAHALEVEARACLEAATFEAGKGWLDLDSLAAFDPAVRSRALTALIAAVAGSEREPAEASVDRLLGQDFRAATLGGAWIRRIGNALVVGRDPGAILGRRGKAALGRQLLAPGAEIVWDGRLALAAQEAGWSCIADAEGASPLFERGGACLTLIEARDRGLVTAQWLFRERIAHLLWR